ATAAGPLAYAVLNHATAAFLVPREIPYFLLTDPAYIAAYRERFARNAGVAGAEWRRRFREAPVGAAFMAEKRDRARHDPAFPDRGVWGLSVWRTRLARACTGEVLRAGKGWDDGPPRQEMPGWHRDKLERLEGRCRYVSAVENTHMAGYVTEKIFDAFAVGGMPLYVAAPGHAVFDLVGAGGWINLYRPEGRGGRLAAPAFDAGRPVAVAEADAYARVQDRLARLFADDAAVARALDRVADGIAAALAALAGRPSG
ncbi:MAG: hypothetical protein IT545_09310, partial [Rhodobacteraceae bacterium]|nr:hypothetical protein [Paracoccaceae bacterium]